MLFRGSKVGKVCFLRRYGMYGEFALRCLVSATSLQRVGWIRTLSPAAIEIA
jgi:hypothetical protein